MLFQHTWQAVLEQRKTQTRRIVKPNQTLIGLGKHATVMNDNLRNPFVYAASKTYAVQPGRGKKAVARIEITDIRHEDVRCISIDDAFAEGFQPDCDIGVKGEAVCNFLTTWTKMHDPTFKFWFEPRICDWMWHTNKRQLTDGTLCVGTWPHVLEAMKDRPAERYQAWAITFKLVQS